MLTKCAGCHEQCLFLTSEVFAAGTHAYATSRKAQTVIAAQRGGWTADAVDVVYSGLSSGIQHEVCVYRGTADTWPDERSFLWPARREIVETGHELDWVKAEAARLGSIGPPYPEINGDEDVVLWLDAATLEHQPETEEWCNNIANVLGLSLGIVRGGTSGFLAFDLGLIPQARRGATVAYAVLNALPASAQVITDSPEVAWTIGNLWPELGVPALSIVPMGQWIDAALRSRLAPTPVGRGLVAIHDSGYLVRDLGDHTSTRSVLQQLAVPFAEFVRHGRETPASGSFHGTAQGLWTRAVAAERAQAARSMGVSSIVTTSPFDYANLRQQYDAIPLTQIVSDSLITELPRDTTPDRRVR